MQLTKKLLSTVLVVGLSMSLGYCMEDNTETEIEIQSGDEEELAKILIDMSIAARTTPSPSNLQNWATQQLISRLIRGCSCEEVAKLIEAGADVNARNVNARENKLATVLHIALRKSRARIVHLLLKAGADINTPDSNGITPLQIVKKYPQRYKLVLPFFAEIQPDILQQPNLEEITPEEATHQLLSRLSAVCSIEEIESLIAAGANVNEKNSNGLTPLHILLRNFRSQHSQVGAIKALLNAGADVNIENDSGKTPLQIIIKNKKFSKNKQLYERIYDLFLKAAKEH